MNKSLKEVSEKQLRSKIAKYKDIFRIPRKYKLPEHIMEEVAEEIKRNVLSNRFYYAWRTDKEWWSEICVNQELNEDFIIKNKNILNWAYIFRYQKLSEKFMFDNAHMSKWFWSSVSANKYVDVDFLERHKQNIKWNVVSSCYPLTEETIEKFGDLLSWNQVFERINMSEEFILKHQDKINWTFLLKNPYLAFDFFERNQNKIMINLKSKDLTKIIEFQKVSEETLKKIKKGKMVWRAISANCNISKDFLLENYNNIHIRYLIWQNNKIDIDVKNEVKMIESLSGNKY